MILSHLCSLNAILFSSHDSLFVFICKNTHCSLVIFKLYPHSLFSILQPLLFINNKCASMEIFWLHGYRHFWGREGVSATQLHYLMYFTQPAVNYFQYFTNSTTSDPSNTLYPSTYPFTSRQAIHRISPIVCRHGRREVVLQRRGPGLPPQVLLVLRKGRMPPRHRSVRKGRMPPRHRDVSNNHVHQPSYPHARRKPPLRHKLSILPLGFW